MDNVYIRKDYLNKWEAKYFKDKENISVEDILTVIDSLDDEIDYYKIQIKDLKNEIAELKESQIHW